MGGGGLRAALKRGLRKGFELGQWFGLDVLPRHFYSQIPNMAQLRADRTWRESHEMVGVHGVELAEQADFVRETCRPDVVARAEGVHDRANARNGATGYGPIEALFLYCFIAVHRPRRIIQVGAGVSTAVLIEAAERHEMEVEIICVDPFPTDYLTRLAQAGAIELVAEPAQKVSLATLTSLERSEMLFVDSTHAVRPGSEVNRLILEVLPRLAAGVWIHFHDIVWPFDYNPWVLTDDLFFWNESVLLHALLVGNEHVSVRASLSMVHNLAPDVLRSVIPTYSPMMLDAGVCVRPGHYPSATYLQTT